jgi:fatty acid desaturase
MLLPLASFFNFSDFYVHRSPSFTRSTALSLVISATYTLGYLTVLYRLFGILFPIIVFLLLPHVGFCLDRLRQYTEHNLMPLESSSGARSLGIGFWGLLIGGGPWGQPCHMAHHMVPSIPWYQQILLHRFIVRLLTPEQRKQFLLPPVLGFPMLLWSIIRDANRLARTTPSQLSLTGD